MPSVHRAVATVIAALLFVTSTVSAQSTTGTISGRITDTQGLPVPGAAVTVTSPALQGSRTAITADNGDYVIPLLPPGSYTVAVELTGFEKQERRVNLAPTQSLPVNVTMGLAAVEETVQVVGTTANVLGQTAQVAIDLKQELVSALPTARDLAATLLLAPAVQPTGPSGNFAISGAMSFDSLFLVNGVTVNENVRGQAVNLYIEDAVQETTVASAGVSAEYGRFGGGVVNVITKSGGNTFSGSFRDTLANDKWRTLTPYEKNILATNATAQDPRVKNVVPQYEGTLGGRIVKDRLWFFTAGRWITLETGRQLVATNIPYTFASKTRRLEGKLTYSLTSSHKFQGSVTKNTADQTNNTFNTSLSMDVRSLSDRQLPDDLWTVNYSGILSSRLFVEARASGRRQQFIGSGAKSTDLIEGTLLIDRQRGNTRYWADTFCGVCSIEKRNNEDIFAKASWFVPTEKLGSHNLVFGGDSFNDIRSANNHQSGSDYRILGTGTTITGTGTSAVITPVFLGNGTTIIQWNPIPIETKGSNVRTYALFVNDQWRLSNRLTVNAGIRWDKNHALDQNGTLVANDSAFSPRLGLLWDVTGNQQWSVTASYANYVSALAQSIADASSPAGNPQTLQYLYRGPDINPTGTTTLTPTPQAIRQVFDWFFANGGSNLPLNGAPDLPGLTPKITSSLKAPYSREFATGVARQFGNRASLRADFVYRDFGNFYVDRTDTTTGKVSDQFGRSYDLTLIENSDELFRRYKGLSVQGTYRLGSSADIGGTYTLSRTYGNVDGENTGSGPIRAGNITAGNVSGIVSYPEYKQASWNYPTGDLSGDQRHRSRLWINYRLPWVKGLSVSALQTLTTGTPYGTGNMTNSATPSGVDPRPYVTNPGYVTPPSGSATAYFYIARDAFRLEGEKRTDFSVSYNRKVAKTLEAFAQLQVLNLFDQFQLCGCGATTVFANGGGVNGQTINQAILTSVTNAATYQAFNPFTTTPVKGVNWDFGPNFGKAQNRFAYTTPQTVRVSFGVRF
ncbi:MAG: TonB-dependent receptor [Vicinamibacterales bacterium]